MIRPGTNDPRLGDERTKQMRQRLQQMLRGRMQQPRLGGYAQRSVAGPGVRSFGAGSNIHPSALTALTNRMSNAVVPFRGAIPGLPGSAQSASLDTIPDPDSGYVAPPPTGGGPGDRVTPFYGPVQQMLENTPPQQAVEVPGLGGLGGVQSGATSLVPLGGGSYLDLSTGAIHGPGGGLFRVE